MSLLLDTNVISELVRTVPSEKVEKFISKHSEIWVSTITIHELYFGVECMPVGMRRTKLEDAFENVFLRLDSKILPFAEIEAKHASYLRADARKRGRVLHLPDALIAATAYTHHLALATRNISDFEGLGVETVNPWND